MPTPTPIPITIMVHGRPPRNTPPATEAISVACGAASGFGCSAVGIPIP